MKVDTLVRQVLRHKFACFLILCCAVVAAFVGWKSVVPKWQSSAAFVIVPPVGAVGTNYQNPLMNLTGDVGRFGDVMVSVLQSPPAVDAVTAAGAGAGYTVTTSAGDASVNPNPTPLLITTVVAPDAESAREGSLALIAFAKKSIVTLQENAGVAKNNRASLLVTSAPDTEVVASGSRLRTAGAFGVGTAIAGLLVLVAVDATLEGRKRRAAAPGRRRKPDSAGWRRLASGGGGDNQSECNESYEQDGHDGGGGEVESVGAAMDHHDGHLIADGGGQSGDDGRGRRPWGE